MKNVLYTLSLTTMLGIAAVSTACGSAPSDSATRSVDESIGAVPGYQLLIYVIDGTQFYAAGTLDWVVIGTGFPPGAAIIAAGTSEAPVASAIAAVAEGDIALVSGGTFEIVGHVAGTATVGGAAGTVAVAGTLFAAVAIAAGATIAIDCVAHGECIWTTVNNAGGLGVVIGYSPNPASQPVLSATTVSCSNPASYGDQCAQPIGNIITDYYSWFGGSYYTCSDIWGGSRSGDAWSAAVQQCAAALQSCVTNTCTMCAQNGFPARPECQPVADAGADAGAE
jgi:hypothetical protein